MCTNARSVTSCGCGNPAHKPTDDIAIEACAQATIDGAQRRAEAQELERKIVAVRQRLVYLSAFIALLASAASDDNSRMLIGMLTGVSDDLIDYVRLLTVKVDALKRGR